MDNGVRPLDTRLGLGVPGEWWPSGPLLKSFEAAGFTATQVPSPPPSVLRDARQLSRHAAAVRDALGTTGLATAVHAPAELLVGAPAEDRAMEGLLGYTAEIGASFVVYHAHALPDHVFATTRELLRPAPLPAAA